MPCLEWLSWPNSRTWLIEGIDFDPDISTYTEAVWVVRDNLHALQTLHDIPGYCSGLISSCYRSNFRKEQILLHWTNKVETIEVFRWSDNCCKEHRLRVIMLFRDVVLSSPATKSGDTSQELVLLLDLFFFLSSCTLNVDRSFLEGLWSSSGRKVQYSLLRFLLTSVTGSSV